MVSLDFTTGYLAETFTAAVELAEMIYRPNSTTLHFLFYYQIVEIGRRISVFICQSKLNLTGYIYSRVKNIPPL